MIRIGEAASGEQEALICGSLPGEGSFCRQLSREKRGPLIKVLFVLIFSFAQGRATERGPSCWRGGGVGGTQDVTPAASKEREREEEEEEWWCRS